MTRIRSAAPADAPAIRRIARETWHAAYDEILGPETVDECVDAWYARESLTDAVRTASEGADRVFVVAEGGEDEGTCGEGDADGSSDVVGFAQAGPDPDVEGAAMLFRIYVRPPAWGEGVGSALLERIETRLPDRFARLRLAVLADNDVGVSFYESSGFERTAARESGLDADVEEYVYEKPL